MHARHTLESTPLRQRLIAEAPQAQATIEDRVVVGAPRGRALAVLALLGAVLVMAFAPSVIGAVSILDSRILEGVQLWLSWSEMVRHYLDLGRLAITLPLAIVVVYAGQDR